MGKLKVFKPKQQRDERTFITKKNIDPRKILPKLLKNDTGIISKIQLSELSIFDLFQLCEELSQLIITNPEKNLVHIQTLFHLTEWDDIIIVKTALLSTVEIFKNICPLYQIDDEKIQETFHHKISKEDKMMLSYEKNLLEFYEKYLNILVVFSRLKNTNKQTEESIEETNMISDLRYTAVKCLCEIIKNLSHFNYIEKVISFTIKKITNFNEKTKEVVLDAIRSTFIETAHSLYPIKIQILKEIIKVFNTTAETSLPANFVDVINMIEIDTKAEKILKKEADIKKETKKMKREHYKQKFKESKQKNNDEENKKSKKEKKPSNLQEKKLQKEINNELKESMGDIDVKTIANYNSQILTKIFCIYFKILKRPNTSKFFNSALNGIIKFVHMVNIELISSIIDSLKETSELLRKAHIMKKTPQKLLLQRLTTLYTCQEIIRAPGTVLEVDEKGIIMIFYQILLDSINNSSVIAEYSINEKKIFITLMDKIFIEKRQFSMETVASFVKVIMLLSISLSQDVGFCLTLLFIIYKLLTKYQKTLNLLDVENEGFGLDMFNNKIDDPQATNALNTNIMEEIDILLKKTKNKEIKEFAIKLKKCEKISDQMIVSLTPLQFYIKHKNK